MIDTGRHRRPPRPGRRQGEHHATAVLPARARIISTGYTSSANSSAPTATLRNADPHRGRDFLRPSRRPPPCHRSACLHHQPDGCRPAPRPPRRHPQEIRSPRCDGAREHPAHGQGRSPPSAQRQRTHPSHRHSVPPPNKTPSVTAPKQTTNPAPTCANTSPASSPPSSTAARGSAAASPAPCWPRPPAPGQTAKLTRTQLRSLLEKAGRQRGLETETGRPRDALRTAHPRQPPQVEQVMGRQAIVLLHLDRGRRRQHLSDSRPSRRLRGSRPSDPELGLLHPRRTVLQTTPSGNPAASVKAGAYTPPSSWPVRSAQPTRRSGECPIDGGSDDQGDA